MSSTAAEMSKEVIVKSYREARHKDDCLQHKGRLTFCPKCEQRYSLEEIIRAACARMRNNASGSEAPKKSTIGNIEKLPKKWLDVASLRYTYDLHGNKCTMVDSHTRREDWLRNKNTHSVLMHLRFDQHDEVHWPTCFKKNDECRANLPMMVCNKSYLFDNEHILANSNDFHVVYMLRKMQWMKNCRLCMEEVNWHHLSQESPVMEVMQFLAIPKQPQACQFLNQHPASLSPK